MEKICLFDTHAHYDHELFEGKGPQIITQLIESGMLQGAVIPAITEASNFQRHMFPPERYPTIFFAAGLHPKRAINTPLWDAEKKAIFDELLAEPRTVAVKTGLDHCKKKLTDGQKAHQTVFFRYFIQVANQNDLPLVLHVRDAIDTVIEVLHHDPPQTEAVVHCWTADYATAKVFMDAGVTRFGIGGMLTRPDMDSLRDCVKRLPLSALLLETDAPFVKPEGFTGAINTSETLPLIAKRIAGLKDLPLHTVVEALQQNAMTFYRLSI